MRPIMKSESGNGSKGLVWDRESRAIEQNKRLAVLPAQMETKMETKITILNSLVDGQMVVQ